MRNDTSIHKDIVAELSWDPGIRHEDIAISVKDGVVTLAGVVHSYAERYAAERVVERILGVKAVADELIVKPGDGGVRTDAEIAHAIVNAFKWDVEVPDERITAKVTNGHVVLEGKVEWNFQRMAAERAVRNLTGVRGVSNLIGVQEIPTPSDVKQRIATALKRQAEVDAGRITVEAKGHTVILRGTVRSFPEKREAEEAAWRARGVTRVENELIVNPIIPAMV